MGETWGGVMNVAASQLMSANGLRLAYEQAKTDAQSVGIGRITFFPFLCRIDDETCPYPGLGPHGHVFWKDADR